jgi:hypothetical protein
MTYLLIIFFENNEISWSICKAICADSLVVLTGSKKGLRAKVNEMSPCILFTHCMIHKEALAVKKLEPFVNKVLQDAISVINFMKSKALNSRLFTIPCNEMGSDHTKPLLRSVVRWLSRCKILLSIFEFKDEIRIVFLEHKNTLAEHFLNEVIC